LRSPTCIELYPHIHACGARLNHILRDSSVSYTALTPYPPAILDARGQPLFKLKKQLLSIHSTYIGYSPATKQEIFTVKSSFSFGTKLTATFRNVAGDGREMELVLRGNILDRSAEITTKEGVPVARISRSFANAGEVFCGSLLLRESVSTLIFVVTS
jgi:uncharacterized protein YxjI